MRIEKVNDKKLKITISVNDLVEKDLDIESLTTDSPRAQEFFYDLMEQAEMELGFDTYNCRLYIEAIQSASDSFIITITKLEEDPEFESIHKFIKSKYKKSDIKLKKKNRKYAPTTMIYTFEKQDELKELAYRIKNIYFGDSSLYKLNDNYFLVLNRTNWTSFPDNKIFEAVISEYGERINDISLYEGYLNEHGTKIADNDAIEVITNYF